MRHLIFALFMAIGLAVAGQGTASAAPIGADAGASITADAITKVQYAGYCERLRRRCLFEEERGWGNECHRYRVECGRARYCERLRQACRYKWERGEIGQGNCRRWKYECNP